MSTDECPFCNSSQKKAFKEWYYGDVNVSRFICKCGKKFNFYELKKRGKTWTVPKPKNNSS